MLDLSAIAGLGGIEDRGDHHRIGAGVTWAGLRDAARLGAILAKLG